MMKEQNKLFPEDYTYFSKGSKITGDLSFDSQVSISGEITGNLIMTKNAELRLESTSLFQGNINASKIDVYGKCTGGILSNDLVTFHGNSTFEGTLKCKRINIIPGAQLNIKASTQE